MGGNGSGRRKKTIIPLKNQSTIQDHWIIPSSKTSEKTVVVDLTPKKLSEREMINNTKATISIDMGNRNAAPPTDINDLKRSAFDMATKNLSERDEGYGETMGNRNAAPPTDIKEIKRSAFDLASRNLSERDEDCGETMGNRNAATSTDINEMKRSAFDLAPRNLSERDEDYGETMGNRNTATSNQSTKDDGASISTGLISHAIKFSNLPYIIEAYKKIANSTTFVEYDDEDEGNDSESDTDNEGILSDDDAI